GWTSPPGGALPIQSACRHVVGDGIMPRRNECPGGGRREVECDVPGAPANLPGGLRTSLRRSWQRCLHARWRVMWPFTGHADVTAAMNLASRLGDQELSACQSRADIKALLGQRHQAWQALQRVPAVHPLAQLLPSTGAGQAGEPVQQMRMLS